MAGGGGGEDGVERSWSGGGVVGWSVDGGGGVGSGSEKR